MEGQVAKLSSTESVYLAVVAKFVCFDEFLKSLFVHIRERAKFTGTQVSGAAIGVKGVEN